MLAMFMPALEEPLLLGLKRLTFSVYPLLAAELLLTLNLCYCVPALLDTPP